MTPNLTLTLILTMILNLALNLGASELTDKNSQISFAVYPDGTGLHVRAHGGSVVHLTKDGTRGRAGSSD